MPNRSKAEMLAVIESEYTEALDAGALDRLPEIEKRYRKTVSKWKHWQDRWRAGHANPFGTLAPIDGEMWVFLTDKIYAAPYAVSNFGRIYDFAHGRIMKPFKGTHNRELQVQLKSNGHGKYILRTVKRLVADAFIPNPEGHTCIGFKDGNHRNFLPNNLFRYESSYNRKKVSKHA